MLGRSFGKCKRRLFAVCNDHRVCRSSESRQRRSVDLASWNMADGLFKQLYVEPRRRTQQDVRAKRSHNTADLRPVEGPMNIEQLPAMLAARHVKRYPYSQQDDPAVM